MAENRQKKTKKAAKKNKTSMAAVLVIGVVLLMFVNAAMQQPKILANKDKIAQLNEQIAYEQLRAQEVDVLKEKVDTDEYIEKVARDRLGLIKENEKVFVDVAG